MWLKRRKNVLTNIEKWQKFMVLAVAWVTEDTKYLKEVITEKVNNFLTMQGGIIFTKIIRFKNDNKIKKYDKYM